MRAAAVVAVAAVVLLSGCVVSWNDSSSSATIRWGLSQYNCNNGRCSYGSNASPLSAGATCQGTAALEWSASAWKHGSITAVVKDGSGATLHTWTVTKDGSDRRSLEGAAGTWSLEGQTRDANGQFQATLAC